MIDIDTASAEEMARFFVNSAAEMRREDPVRFWGTDNYEKVVRETKEQIEKMGIETARSFAREGKLNFK